MPPKTSAKKKKVRKEIGFGVAHIQSTFNNTIITITDHVGRDRRLGQRRDVRIQGRPEGDAVRRPARGQGRRHQGPGVRRPLRRRPAQGPRRGTGILHPGHAGRRPRDQVHQGRDADPAQRLPRPPPPAGLRAGRRPPWRNTKEPIAGSAASRRTSSISRAHKCLTDKCPLERRAYAPGQHGRSRKRVLGYAIQLREKQKLKRFYGMSEEQFHFFFERAERQKGDHRREPPVHARTAPGQRRLPDRVLPVPGPRPPAHRPRPLPAQRPQVRHRLGAGQAGRRRRLPAPLGQERGHPGRGRLEPVQDRAGLARGRLGEP